MNTDEQLQALAQDQQGHAHCTVPFTLYCIFSYHSEIQKHILISFIIIIIIIKTNLTQ